MANNIEQQGKKKNRVAEYFRNVRIEMKKVIWPTKSELVSYTGVVVLTCAACAVGFWAVDTVCAVALQQLLGIPISM